VVLQNGQITMSFLNQLIGLLISFSHFGQGMAKGSLLNRLSMTGLSQLKTKKPALPPPAHFPISFQLA
jgi:hypothetical protein